MARRYAQLCPVARSLDLLGARWTLLIVRDLLLGPLRFSDLLERLPGMGRNLLTSRLAEMQEHGLLERKKLPAPASSWVYELTEAGHELAEPLAALARWGMKHSDGQPQEGDHLEPDLLAMGLAMAANLERAASLHEEHAFCISGADFHVAWRDGRPRPHRGLAHSPRIRIETSAARLGRALRAHDLSTASTEIHVSGDTSALGEILQLYGLSRANT
ncbi:MAG: helix-turn-helix transcriptional regulator [Deltaproteobacteria bacterium]|nr:helix-turn-helix transcriptional regulator [Deltaproteobacteria bacterium]